MVFMKRFVFILFLAVITLTALPYAAPHVVGGELKIVGDYRVQFRTIPENPEKNQRVLLVFSIQDLELRDVRNVTTRVEVRRGVEKVFDTGYVERDFGDFDVSFTPLDSGEYRVFLDFKIGDGELLSVDFSFNVDGGQRFPVEIVVGLLVLAVAVFLVRRRVSSRG